MKKIITAEYLMTAGRSISPCEEEVELFVKLFGEKGARATKANITRASKAGLNLWWLINNWLPRKAADKYWANRKTIYDKYPADRKIIYDKYLADLKTICDKYLADLKTIDDKYWANRKTIDDKYWANRKTIDDKYLADLNTTDDKYLADLKTIEIEVVYQYLNA